MLTADEVLARAPFVNPTDLLGGMWSETELRVNPRVASALIAQWQATHFSVETCFDTQVTAVDGTVVRAADGRQWRAARIVICSGSDLQTLFPEKLQPSGLKLCKLQMLRSAPQPESVRQTAHLASGLTLRHYTAFQPCPTLQQLKDSGLLALDVPLEPQGFKRQRYQFRVAVEPDGFRAEAVPLAPVGRSFIVDDTGKVRLADE